MSSAATSSSEKALVESFHGVYLLCSLNPRMKGRTYIGFTVDPERRLRQHNRGRAFGGAWRTSDRGPWAMLLVVHGFPNAISALRFEWAWQHPRRSRRLADVAAKRSSERMFEYNFRLLGEMLRRGPWNRLPLTVRWIRPDVRFAEFPPERTPPRHVKVVTGPVASVKPNKKRKKKGQQQEEEEEEEGGLICAVCIEEVPPADQIQCLSDRCRSASHLLCLAERFRQQEEQEGAERRILPLRGTCPVCESGALWGDLVRKKKLSGTYKPRTGAEEEEISEEEESDSEEEEEEEEGVVRTQSDERNHS